MRVLLETQQFPAFGGSETYLITIGAQLQRFGHEVELYAPAGGETATMAREHGIAVLTEEGELPEDPDVAVSQDTAGACELAERYPAAVRVYVAHSPLYEPQRPPQVRDALHAIIVLSDGARDQCDALAEHAEIVRLRQPVDIGRFTDRGELPDRPHRVLILGHHWGDRRWRNHRAVAEACDRLGLELVHIGRMGKVSFTPEAEIARAHVVIGIGRCIVEAMACGRAAYVFGNMGDGGWVTPDSYERLEALGFTADPRAGIIDAARLERDLAAYHAEMGHLNRHLAIAYHDASRHTAALVALFRRLQPRQVADRAVLDPIARMARIQRETENRAAVGEWDAKVARKEAEGVLLELGALRDRHRAIVEGRRYRLISAIARPLEWIRAARGRRPRAAQPPADPISSQTSSTSVADTARPERS
jgi:hypothetical protein